jgi:hypothetical protein
VNIAKEEKERIPEAAYNEITDGDKVLKRSDVAAEKISLIAKDGVSLGVL